MRRTPRQSSPSKEHRCGKAKAGGTECRLWPPSFLFQFLLVPISSLFFKLVITAFTITTVFKAIGVLHGTARRSATVLELGGGEGWVAVISLRLGNSTVNIYIYVYLCTFLHSIFWSTCYILGNSTRLPVYFPSR